ncbi:MAG: VWA domain-containing protein, partial [Acidobacteriota bacterium]|nr:VWA domain-containing protein [Acidobacteriota bacterium]
MGSLLPNLLRFGRLLRALGLEVPAGSMLTAARALEHVDIGRRGDFYHALRCVLVRRAADLPPFDAAFRAFWRRPPGRRVRNRPRAMGEEIRFGEPEVDPPSLAAEAGDDPSSGGPLAEPRHLELATHSAREALRRKDFALYSAAEIAAAETMMARLDWEVGSRRTRRWLAGAGPGLDLRRLLRSAARHGQDDPVLPRRRRKVRRRPLVLICDVSGSMERYTRMLLHFCHSLTGGLEGVESFVFSTRLTRVTPELRRGRINDVLPALSERVHDWSGGTRIGEALGSFARDWARRILGHGAVVLLISDGWDRGDPELLAREMARLQRSCHRLVWLNPLLGAPGYEPLTRGMRAALPLVDDFLPVHNLESLETLARHLNRLPEVVH